MVIEDEAPREYWPVPEAENACPVAKSTDSDTTSNPLSELSTLRDASEASVSSSVALDSPDTESDQLIRRAKELLGALETANESLSSEPQQASFQDVLPSIYSMGEAVDRLKLRQESAHDDADNGIWQPVLQSDDYEDLPFSSHEEHESCRNQGGGVRFAMQDGRFVAPNAFSPMMRKPVEHVRILGDSPFSQHAVSKHDMLQRVCSPEYANGNTSDDEDASDEWSAKLPANLQTEGEPVGVRNDHGVDYSPGRQPLQKGQTYTLTNPHTAAHSTSPQGWKRSLSNTKVAHAKQKAMSPALMSAYAESGMLFRPTRPFPGISDAHQVHDALFTRRSNFLQPTFGESRSKASFLFKSSSGSQSITTLLAKRKLSVFVGSRQIHPLFRIFSDWRLKVFGRMLRAQRLRMIAIHVVNAWRGVFKFQATKRMLLQVPAMCRLTAIPACQSAVGAVASSLESEQQTAKLQRLAWFVCRAIICKAESAFCHWAFLVKSTREHAKAFKHANLTGKVFVAWNRQRLMSQNLHFSLSKFERCRTSLSLRAVFKHWRSLIGQCSTQRRALLSLLTKVDNWKRQKLLKDAIVFWKRKVMARFFCDRRSMLAIPPLLSCFIHAWKRYTYIKVTSSEFVRELQWRMQKKLFQGWNAFKRTSSEHMKATKGKRICRRVWIRWKVLASSTGNLNPKRPLQAHNISTACKETVNSTFESNLITMVGIGHSQTSATQTIAVSPPQRNGEHNFELTTRAHEDHNGNEAAQEVLLSYIRAKQRRSNRAIARAVLSCWQQSFSEPADLVSSNDSTPVHFAQLKSDGIVLSSQASSGSTEHAHTESRVYKHEQKARDCQENAAHEFKPQHWFHYEGAGEFGKLAASVQHSDQPPNSEPSQALAQARASVARAKALIKSW